MDANAWDERYSKTELEWGSEPNRFLVAEIEGMTPGVALDVASGEGRNAVWLAERGWAVTAVDFSKVGVDKGRRLAQQRGVDVTFVVGDVLDYEPSDISFDLIVVFYLQLVPVQWKQVLRRTVRALKPGGTLLIVGHDRSNLTGGVGGPSDPAILLDAQEIVSDLSDLHVEKAGRVLRPVAGEERDAIDTLVRVRK